MPSAEIILERSMYFGLIFSSMVYGVDLTLFFHSFRLLWKKRHTKHSNFYMIYSSFLLLFQSISLASDFTFGDLIWIDDRNVPGGPPAFYVNNSSAWYNVFGTAANITSIAMADGLLLYRCFMFWYGHRWIIILPALLYVSSIVVGILTTIESALPGASIFEGLAVRLSISWLSLTVSFNVIVTAMIIARVLATYRTVRDTLGAPFLATYIDISAMLVESALPYSLLGIGCLVTQVVNNNVDIAFAYVWATFAALLPQFIIYRVALGVAWSRDTIVSTLIQDVRFAPNPDDEFKSNQEGSSGVLRPTFGGSDNTVS